MPWAHSAGIAGASGYAGQELLRLLDGHPSMEVLTAQARSDGFAELDVDHLATCDVVFLCLPHGTSRGIGEALAQRSVRVVDVGSDFRVGGWVYGLPEFFRGEIAAAATVANPGCYATAAIIALAPLAEAGFLDGPPAIDGKSGVTGAGRAPSEKAHLPNLYGGIQPYTRTGHRHIAEIEQALGRLGGRAQTVAFTPHLLPTSRGLLVTAYARVRGIEDEAALLSLYLRRYHAEPFVRFVDDPAPQHVAGANTVEVAVSYDARTGTAICCAALDNLVKGAAGQAIQNANLMLGLPEGAGLPLRGVWP